MSRRRNGAKDRAVLEVMRDHFKARTPGMPLPLRAKITAAIAAEEKPAAAKPVRKRVRTPFFGMGYTGALLAACLCVAVGVAWYAQNARTNRPALLRAETAGLADGLIARIVRAEAGELIDGRLPVEPVAEAAGLADLLGRRFAGLPRRVEFRVSEWTLLGVRPAASDPTSAAWFVFTDGRERIAVLVSPAGGDSGDPAGTFAKPVFAVEGGLNVAAMREGGAVVVAAGRLGRERLSAFVRATAEAR
jgi:hypothetical protein